MSLDAKTQLPVKLPDFDDALALQLTRVPDIVDKVDHNYEIRPKPGSKHKLRRWRSSRGAKVEIYHGQSKHYGNLGTNWRTFQAQQMEGAARFNADRGEENKQSVGVDGDASTRAETRVPHYRPWLQRERNRLAVAAGFEPPYPEVPFERPADNGERFYVEYAFEQEERRKAWAAGRLGEAVYSAADIIAAGGCPCAKCKGARDARDALLSFPPATRVFRPRPPTAAAAVMIDIGDEGQTHEEEEQGQQDEQQGQEHDNDEDDEEGQGQGGGRGGGGPSSAGPPPPHRTCSECGWATAAAGPRRHDAAAAAAAAAVPFAPHAVQQRPRPHVRAAVLRPTLAAAAGPRRHDAAAAAAATSAPAYRPSTKTKEEGKK